MPLEAVGAGLRGREFARKRERIIAANAELQERELIKLASWAAALADTLRSRGVADPLASLTGEVAMGVSRNAFERWLDQSSRRGPPELIRDALDQLRKLTSSDPPQSQTSSSVFSA
jgi:hypothetical protein